MSCHLWLGGLIKIRFQMMKKNVYNSNSNSGRMYCDDMQMAVLFNSLECRALTEK